MAQVWSVVVAGGSGQRFGTLKQFALLAERPVVEWAVAACRVSSSGVVLVVPPGAVGSGQLDFGADVVVEGGATRTGSVCRGVAAVPETAEVIVVHDAARPLASADLFRAVIAAVTPGGAGGAVPGVPVSDTIKVVDASQWVTATLDRATLVAVQTPQAFDAALLRRAHAHGTEATDDAALVEALGATVRVVPGDPRNLKITTPADLELAEHLLRG
ncbi:MAG: 2-C-methyl-D-erythritol 4-phosphate cytidylyltransferase [Acidimicrobiales bacterium]